MAGLHDAIKATGYTGKDLETYLVRLLFCLFADSTGLFGENNQFLNYLLHYRFALFCFVMSKYLQYRSHTVWLIGYYSHRR